MASRGDIQAGKAFVELYVKNSALVKGLNDAKKQLQGLGKSIMGVGAILTGAGAAIVTPLVAAVSQFAAMGSELADMSARTGMAAGSLAELKFAAEQSGAGIEDVEIAIKKMQKEGITGTFDEVAAKIAAIEDPAKRTQAALETWGKSGTKLLPMIANLAALRQEARDLGLVPTEEAVGLADAIGDAFDAVRSVMKAVVFNIGAALAPVLLPALKTVVSIAAWFNRWSKTNGEIIRSVLLIGGGLLSGGAAITAIGALVFGLGTAFGAVATVATTVASIVGGLLSPVVLMTAAVIGGVVAWTRFTSSGRAAVEAVRDFAMPIIGTIRETLGGIGDALTAGKLELAGKIAVMGLRLVFMQGLDAITGMIGGTLGAALGDVGSRVINGDLKGAWQSAVAFMGKMWADFTGGIVGLFVQAADAILRKWQAMVSAIANSLLEQSANGGLVGKAVSKVLGVDLQEEQKRLDKINARGAKLGTFNTSQTDSLGFAQSGVGASVNGMASPIKEFLDTFKSTAENAAAEAGGKLTSRLGATPSAEVSRLQDELAELRRQAEDAKKNAADAKGATAAGLDVGGLKASASVVGFSGAALLASGFGGGMQDMAKDIRAQLIEQRKQSTHLKALAEKEGALVT